MLIALGTLVAIDYAGVYGFWRTWPILIILFGVLKLLEHSAANRRALPRRTHGYGKARRRYGRTGRRQHARTQRARRKRDMRRGSVIGPLILIGFGALFCYAICGRRFRWWISSRAFGRSC